MQSVQLANERYDSGLSAQLWLFLPLSESALSAAIITEDGRTVEQGRDATPSKIKRNSCNKSARKHWVIIYNKINLCVEGSSVPNTGGKLEKGLELQIKVEQILVTAYTDIIKLISIILE